MYDRLPRNGYSAAAICAALIPLMLTAFGCSNPAPEPEDGTSEGFVGSDSPRAENVARASPNGPRLVFLGNSLTAGYGLSEEQAFPAIVGRLLAERGLEVRVVNAGVSGDTSAGGLNRLDWLLRQSPDILVVGLGGNDGLRGLSVEMTESNLRRIVLKARESGVVVVLLGLRLPPNLGASYVAAFESIYPRLADELAVPLVPFMLEGVAGEPNLNLPDGIHPTAAGQQRVAETIVPWIEEALSKLPPGDHADSAQDRAENGAP